MKTDYRLLSSDYDPAALMRTHLSVLPGCDFFGTYGGQGIFGGRKNRRMNTTERRNQNQQTKQARVKRRQIEWQPVALDQLLAVDQRSRVAWERGWCGGMSIRSI